MDVYRACFNQRDRALVGVVFTTGIALETLSKLKWSHFESDWQRQDFPHISIGSEFLKGHGLGKYKGVRQETFVTPTVKTELVKYRDWMTKQYGFVWQDNMNVFWTVTRNHTTKNYEPLTWNGLAGLIIDLSRRANVKFSIHDGQRIVETALESVGCSRNWIQKIKGRKVRGEDAPYSKPAIEQLRQKYREAAGELEFLGREGAASEEETIKTLKQNVEEQNRVIQKLQSQVNLLVEGAVERDRQFMELKHPRLKAMDKTGEK